MSLYHNELIRAYTLTRHHVINEEEMTRLKKVKKHLKEKHEKIKRNLRRQKQLNEEEMKKQQRYEEIRGMEQHRLKLEELEEKFQVKSQQGLTDEEAAFRLGKYGKNKLTEENQKHWALIFLEQMIDPFSLFMWFLTALSFLEYGLSMDSNSLFLAIIISITIVTSAFVSYSFTKDSSDVIKKFKDIVPQFAKIRRNGILRTIKSEDLVPGDIIEIPPGELIPADVRVIESNGMNVNDNIFTGESILKEVIPEECEQSDPFEAKNILYSGYVNEEGDGVGIIIRTGENTLLAHLSDIVSSADKKVTSIEKQISRFVKIMTIFAFFIGILVLFVGVAIGYPWKIAAMIATGVTIASAPGILNLEVTILLTLAVKRLSEKAIISKNLHVIEELGSTSCLCSDKTGTITMNKMMVSHLHFNSKSFKAKQVTKNTEINGDPTFLELHKCAVLSSMAVFDSSPPIRDLNKINSRVDISEETKKDLEQEFRRNWEESYKTLPSEQLPTIGDATESGIIRFFNLFEKIDRTRQKFPTKHENGHDFHSHFDPVRKYSYSVCHQEVKNSHFAIYIKGAPEVIWKMCSHIMINGEKMKKGHLYEERFQKYLNQFGGSGERIIGFAKKNFQSDTFHRGFRFRSADKRLKKQMTFIGMVSMKDPPKKGIGATIQKLKVAGIKIVMLTGDQEKTATAIARQCKIIQEPETVNEIMQRQNYNFNTAMKYSEAVVINGQRLTEILIQDESNTQSQKGKTLQKILQKREVVFARTNPSQKLSIVQALKKMGHIVTVTGDGVNDSPAVKFSDAGICMGTGADATREAADMIIADDDLNHILQGIQQGRKLFDNLKKSICYVMTSQVSEWAPFILLLTARIPIPIFTLLIDGTADFVPALSYAFEPGQIGIMTRPPRDQKQHLVTYNLLWQCSGWMGWSSFMCSLLCFFICMKDFGFQPSGLFAKNNIDILLHKDDDTYNPTSPYFGNSNLENLKTCQQFYQKTVKIDWINSLYPQQDLRMAAVTCEQTSTGLKFAHNLPFSECRVQQISIITHKPVCYTTEAAKYGQTAYMYANVVNQVFNLFICRTRRQSLFTQPFNNKIIYFGLSIEIMLALALNQTVFLIQLIGTRDTIYMHYGLGAIPFGMIQLLLDEIRKYLIRNLPADNMNDPSRKPEECKPNWFERLTLW